MIKRFLFSASSKARFVRTLACLSCVVMLSACAEKELDLPDNSAMELDDSALLESYRQALQDDGIPLTDTEMRAFISSGEMDKNLTEEQLRVVQVYYKHYLHRGRPVIERFLQRSEPYIEYTRQVFRERGLPEELANLAYVESGYNPVAVSRSKAVGMWQFMAGTGRQYGLRQDWWIDERRDPYRATHAAADYLTKLHGDFRDWHLAVAAYNAGEGKIGRALSGTGASDFFTLCDNNYMLDEKAQLKEETKQYLPRFLAITKIMRNADDLGFVPAAPQEGKPVLQPAVALTARPGTDLAALAKQMGMTWVEFAAYNPAFIRYVTPPDRHMNVYVPAQAEAHASQLLQDDTLVPVGLALYTIVKGDTLSGISSRTGVPVRVLRQMNPKCEPLRIGARLHIPGRAGSSMLASAPAAKPASRPSAVAGAQPVSKPVVAASPNPASKPTVVAVAKPSGVAAKPVVKASPSGNISGASGFSSGKHTVKAGETLASIGRKYEVNLAAMRKANGHIKNLDVLRVGQSINIPTTVATYKVQPGDTMYGIARKFNMPPGDLLALNNMKSNQVIRAGQTVRVRN